MASERGSDGRSQPGGSATEGLPQAFLHSLRTLFDILDDRRRGYVHLREIESRWLQQGSEAGELPRGVLEGLRRAAPASGYLTFERFVLGLRSSLLSPETGGTPPAPANKGPGRPAAHPPKSREEAERASGRGASGGASRPLEKTLSAPAECRRAATKGASGGIRKLAGQAQYESTSRLAVEMRRQLRDRGEHRRHTITNGVDYSMLKQMKELEKQKDLLLQGLELVERMREWHHQQIHALQEHQKQLSSSRVYTDSFSEGRNLVPKLQELNQRLSDLLCLSAKPLNPSFAMGHVPHSALATSPPLIGSQQAFNMLKEQNRLLTREVTDKSDRITQLELEKSALIKQLFEARAQSHQESNQLDSTFI